MLARSDAGRILVVGGGGQLADALVSQRDCEVLKRSELDITRRQDVMDAIASRNPRVVINAAAYTAVDRAEADVEAALQVNRDGPSHLAAACRATGARLVHVSTDFVFDGSASSPIGPSATTCPVSVYGQSKLEGEIACREILGDEALILRTAWVYAAGHLNFVATMLRLMREREEIGVVADQIGSPTWAHTLARGILELVDKGVAGTHHLTDAGVASWYDFAVAILELGRGHGLLARSCRIRPIRTEDYPTTARRPAFSVLDKTSTFSHLGGPTPHWRQSLDQCLVGWRDPA